MSQYDADHSLNNISRRALLTSLGISGGLLLANSGQNGWLTGSDLSSLSYQEVLSLLDSSLSPVQRELVVLPWDDPTRQITNTVAIHKGPHIATLFDPYQVALLRQLYKTMLSNQGQQWFHNTTRLEGKFEGSSFRIYSDAAAGSLASSDRTISMINGGHYMLRHGEGVSEDNVYVFGGPVAYGQQLGNKVFKVQGNAFKAHGDAVNEFRAVLTASELASAYKVSPPMELVTQVQGVNGTFSGLRIGDASEEAREKAREMLATIFAAYPDTQQRDAFTAIEQNGGVESLYISLYKDYSFYKNGERFTDMSVEQYLSREQPYTQVWRIEGPACVIHFQGYPHVHAYINVVRDPNRVAIGDVLGTTALAISGPKIIDLYLAALRFETGERYAYFPMKPAGRLAPGPISTGSIYSLDPYDNACSVIEMEERAMTPMLKASLVAQGANLGQGKRCRIATIAHMIEDSRDLGSIDRVISISGSMRESLVALIRKNEGRLSV